MVLDHNRECAQETAGLDCRDDSAEQRQPQQQPVLRGFQPPRPPAFPVQEHKPENQQRPDPPDRLHEVTDSEHRAGQERHFTSEFLENFRKARNEHREKQHDHQQRHRNNDRRINRAGKHEFAELLALFQETAQLARDLRQAAGLLAGFDQSRKERREALRHLARELRKLFAFVKAAPQPLHDIALLLAAAFLQHREAVFQRNPRRQQRGKAARKYVDVEARCAPQPEMPGFPCRLPEGADHDQPLPPQPAARSGIVRGIDRDLFPGSPGGQDGITQFRHRTTPPPRCGAVPPRL